MCAADLPPLNTTGKKTLRCCLQVQSAGALLGINVLHLPPPFANILLLPHFQSHLLTDGTAR